MHSFACPACGSLLFFENSRCLACGSEVGYRRDTASFALPDAQLGGCARRFGSGCNWLAWSGAPGGLCDCCALLRVPPPDDETAAAAWARAAAAARRLVHQLDGLRLPVIGRDVDPQGGLAFDLRHGTPSDPVVIGHRDGVITIDLAEGDDGYREGLRVRLAEAYRTLLGHFRHEVGHWYWTMLVADTPALWGFRSLFGDERLDYSAALSEHYAGEPPPDWVQRHVSVYATAHPWEDWAETFAHYLHIRDALQTAAAFGVVVAGPDLDTPPSPEAPLASVPLEDPPDDFDEIVKTWLPLTFALNQVNRSMGRRDLYPFLLAPAVIEKLRFVHRLVRDCDRQSDPVPPPGQFLAAALGTAVP
ncbi:MAG TPA: putative zinc-binding metallopeptidase [Sporichthyaceae bacterium]|jgi:hypothetical protein|nr:putative zinc-binding metallopeptidase [Sporichthyaceae bacterium]